MYIHIDFQHELMDSDNTKSTSEIKAMYEEIRYKQFKENIIQHVKKEIDLSFQQTLSNVELHFYERIAQLESLVENNKILQTDQILQELDAKNNIFTKLLDENILRKFSNTPSQNNLRGLTRERSGNLENLHESSLPLCQDSNTPMLNRNASVNKLEKENAMKIAQNKKMNDQLTEIRKHVIKSLC